MPHKRSFGSRGEQHRVQSQGAGGSEPQKHQKLGGRSASGSAMTGVSNMASLAGTSSSALGDGQSLTMGEAERHGDLTVQHTQQPDAQGMS